ncbi:MAG TPA: hypothetical protein VHX37_01230 [Acidobacteriaceae bacterium]|jgi:hypothetical protein|nr:hypothetical protein [Acidobacteriaceae bacterium]
MSPFRFAFLPALILLAAPVLFAQQAATPPPAPVPSGILAGQKVFLTNAGMDAYSQAIYGHFTLQPTEPYDALYAGLKSWGRWQLVSAPGDADLVFEVRTREQQTGCGVGTAQFQIVLALYDAKTHFLLWNLTQPIEIAARAETWRKNVATANDNLLGQLKSLVTPASPPQP